MPPAPARALPGYLALGLAVAIWAGWIIIVRGTVNRAAAPLGPLDIALLRYMIPAVLLAPVWLRIGPLPRGLAPIRLVAMVLGWGAPFAMLGAQGLKTADTALFATLVPAGMPLWLSLILMGLTRRLPPAQAAFGATLIAVGVAGALALAIHEGRGVAGVPWLLAASFGWASYTAAYRGSGLSPVQATALMAFWSSLGLLPALWLSDTTLADLPPLMLVREAMLQGVLSGVVSVLAFAMAIDRLGAAIAAGGAALVPVLTALGGWWWLGDPLSAPVLGLLACTVVGVALINTAPLREKA